jgi:hypothetical protein
MNKNHELYRVENMPLFQNRMYHDAHSACTCETGDVVLVQDNNSGLVYNAAFEADRIVYDADYQNEQANSTAFRQHLDWVATLIQRHLKGKRLIEVGCGKGGFLDKLVHLGFEITGMDPAYEGNNPAIRKEYFSKDSAITGDGIILRHVLEHIQNPVEFLKLIRDANGGSGWIYIEVPCLDWIIRNNSWFDIFYEHVNYFRLSDFQRIFSTVIEASHSFNGQYLSVLADLSSLREPLRDEPMLEFPASFTKGIHQQAAKLKASKDSRVAIWGGASKGVIFALQMMREGIKIETVVDINPAKQGKFLAVTGLRVESPDQLMARLPHNSEIIVMNPNYLNEIREITCGRYQYLTI